MSVQVIIHLQVPEAIQLLHAEALTADQVILQVPGHHPALHTHPAAGRVAAAHIVVEAVSQADHREAAAVAAAVEDPVVAAEAAPGGNNQ